jgi:hypothetical protein
MESAPGLASGALAPEDDIVYLAASWDLTPLIEDVTNHEEPLDVWAVDVSGLALEEDSSEWIFVREPIAPQRLSLIATDVRPQEESTGKAWTLEPHIEG